jgi:hypothetical protein
MRYVTRFSLRAARAMEWIHLYIHPQDMLEAKLNEAATLKRLLDGMKVL